MKLMFGAAIQGAPDYHTRKAVNRRIIQHIKGQGMGLVAEHTAETSHEDIIESLEQSIGPLPNKDTGLKRVEFIRNSIINEIEGNIDAAIFEASIPSVGTGIELTHAYMRSRLGERAIPILVLFQENYYRKKLSAMIKGLPFWDMPNVEVHYYEDLLELDGIVLGFLDRIRSGALNIGLVSITDERPEIISEDARKLFNPIGLFVSMVPPQRAAEISDHHKSNFQKRQRRVGSSKLKMKYLGLDIEVDPDVFEPREISKLLGEQILSEVKPSDRVLEVNCASGVNAIIAASKAEYVEAVDVNPIAVRNTRENAWRNGVAGKIKVYESDVFDNVEGKFDLILTDPPFKWFKPRSMYERSLTDENYEDMRRFISQAHRYLKPGGRILMLFSESGDIEYVRYLIKYSGFKCEEIIKFKYTFNGMRNYSFVFRLTLRQ